MAYKSLGDYIREVNVRNREQKELADEGAVDDVGVYTFS